MYCRIYFRYIVYYLRAHTHTHCSVRITYLSEPAWSLSSKLITRIKIWDIVKKSTSSRCVHSEDLFSSSSQLRTVSKSVEKTIVSTTRFTLFVFFLFSTVIFLNYPHWFTKYHSQVTTTPTLYFGGNRFSSQPGDYLHWLSILWFSSSSRGKCFENTSN
jgi:hypothetical protein